MKIQKIYLGLLFLLLIANSCKKDSSTSIANTDIETFFDHKSNVPLVEWALTNLKEQNLTEKFVPKTVQLYGKPDWDFADAFYAYNSTPTIIIPFSNKETKSIDAIWIIVYENKLMQTQILKKEDIAKQNKSQFPRAESNAYTHMFKYLENKMFNTGTVSIITPQSLNKTSSVNNPRANKLSYFMEIETCTDWYQTVSVRGETIGEPTYLRTTCKTEYQWVNELPAYTPGYNGSTPPGGPGGTGGPGTTPMSYNVTPNYTDEAVDPSTVILPWNKLCSSSFSFSMVVEPDASQNSRGWKEASVKGLTINVLPSNYLENIWALVTTGTPYLSDTFDLQVGAPGDLPNAMLQKEAGLAANLTMVQIEKKHGQAGLKILIETGLLGKRIAEGMEKQMKAVIPGARVSNVLSGRTKPSAPKTGNNCN